MNVSAQPHPESLAGVLLQCWQGVPDPLTQRPFVHARNLHIHTDAATGAVAAEIDLPYPARNREADLKESLLLALSTAKPSIAAMDVRLVTRVRTHAVPAGTSLLPGVKNMVAVASAKGGVGKSTTAVNLALALASEGARVGLLDADIYGPSVPMLMGLRGQEPEVIDNVRMLPLESHGIKIMSMGLLVPDEKAVIWRAPMALKALDQLLRQTQWGVPPDDVLDYLIVDMPPGTGDIQLSLSQRVPITGAVIVTTPQDIALADARKGVAMFEKVGVPILGLVENMAVHVCSNCGHVEHIFGAEGGKRYAAEKGIDYLGALPLALSIREQADSGRPSVVADPDGQAATNYKAIARQVAIKVAARAKDFSAKFPSITISRDT